MKILHVLDHSVPLQSGYTFRTLNILREQAHLGWETCHVTGLKHGDSKESVEYFDDIKFYRTASSNPLLTKAPVIKQIHGVQALTKRIKEVIDIEEPTVLHAHSPALNGIAALNAARSYDLPVVYECRAFWEDAAVDHGTNAEGDIRYQLIRKLENIVFRRAQAVTTICEGLRKDIVARGIEEQKITVIPNSVTAENFEYGAGSDPELVESLGLDGKIVLGFIGSFYAYEGLSLLVSALPMIQSDHPDVALLLVGGGPEVARLEKQISEAKLDKSIVSTGRVPNDEVERFYRLVDIFVYPRLPMRLTELVTPLKPLEAMAQGKLVLASDVGGHRELIEHGENGFLFEADSSYSLAETVSQLIDKRHAWGEIQRASRSFVERERSWKRTVSKYAQVYEAVL